MQKKREAGNLLPKSKVFTFNPSNQPVQVEVINNEPWFVAVDVCDALHINNVSDAMLRLDDDERLTSVVSRSGQNREVNLVNESGLYSLIFQSRKPEARAFRKWVTGEVLPSIRRSGSYVARNRRNDFNTRGHEPLNVETMQLLWLVGDYLNHGDAAQVALQLGVSRISVSRVLNGRQRSPRILAALYEKALSNRNNLRQALYLNPQKSILELTGGSKK